MTVEVLNNKRAAYQQKAEYFKNINFDILAADFQGIVDLIDEMENYIKEKENGED